MKAIMGLFHVSASLTGPTGRTATLDLLVDTGATLLVVPRSLADQLVAERSLVPPASPPRSARAQPESPRSLRATPRAIRAASQSGCVAARKALSRSLASSQLSWA